MLNLATKLPRINNGFKVAHKSNSLMMLDPATEVKTRFVFRLYNILSCLRKFTATWFAWKWIHFLFGTSYQSSGIGKSLRATLLSKESQVIKLPDLLDTIISDLGGFANTVDFAKLGNDLLRCRTALVVLFQIILMSVIIPTAF